MTRNGQNAWECTQVIQHVSGNYLPTYMGVLEALGKLYTHTGDAKLKNYIFILLLCVPIVTEYKLSEGCESPTN